MRFSLPRGIPFPLQFSPSKQRPQVGLRHGAGQIPAVENLHPGHRVLVRFLLGVSPVNENIATPDLDLTRIKTAGEEYNVVASRRTFSKPFSTTGGYVRLVLQETEPAVVVPAVRGGVDDTVSQAS